MTITFFEQDTWYRVCRGTVLQTIRLPLRVTCRGQPNSRNCNRATIRLLVIPCIVYAAWLLEIFLLEGSPHLFERFDPLSLFLYTLIACILTGTVMPLFCIRTAFISGAVNLFQIGFRSFRRTIIGMFLTGIICYAGQSSS